MSVSGKNFVLKHVITDASTLEPGVFHYGEEETHFDVPWRIGVLRQFDFILFGLQCLKPKESDDWTIDTEFELLCGEHVIQKDKYGFGFKSLGSWIWLKCIECENMEKFIIEDNLPIEFRVAIKKMTGIKESVRNFDESAKKFSDVVLNVNAKKFYVSKLFLASQSKYFESLLLGNFDESKQSEISLKDINSYDFQHFLEVIHGELVIDDDTVDGILHLADMYDSKMAIQRCEQFIKEQSTKSLKDKLNLSTQYNLQVLKEFCLSQINTVPDISSVLSEDLNEMDHSVLVSLFKKLLSHHQN